MYVSSVPENKTPEIDYVIFKKLYWAHAFEGTKPKNYDISINSIVPQLCYNVLKTQGLQAQEGKYMDSEQLSLK